MRFSTFKSNVKIIFIILTNSFVAQYNLNDAISRDVQELFEAIASNEFDIPDEYNTRDWISLYNFQKYYIHATIERVMELVEVKQEHDWMIYEESAWKGQS